MPTIVDADKAASGAMEEYKMEDDHKEKQLAPMYEEHKQLAEYHATNKKRLAEAVARAAEERKDFERNSLKVNRMGRPIRDAAQAAQNPRGENAKLGFYSFKAAHIRIEEKWRPRWASKRVARARPTKKENDSEGKSCVPNKEVNAKKRAYTAGAAKMSNDIKKKSRVKDQCLVGEKSPTKKENDSEEKNCVLNNMGRSRKVNKMGRPIRDAAQAAQNQRGENATLGFYSFKAAHIRIEEKAKARWASKRVARARPTKKENDSKGKSCVPNKEVNAKKRAYTAGAAKKSNDIKKKSRGKDQCLVGEKSPTKKENDSEEKSGVLNKMGRPIRPAAKPVRDACNTQIREEVNAKKRAKRASAAKKSKDNKKHSRGKGLCLVGKKKSRVNNKTANFPGKGLRLDSTNTTLDSNKHQDGPNITPGMSFSEIMKADAPHIPLNSYTIAKIDSSDHAINLLLVNGSKLNDNFKKMLGDGVLEMVTENLNNDKLNVVLGGRVVHH